MIFLIYFKAAWLCRALTCIDLTTLSGDDTETNVQRLCLKAAKPVRQDLLESIGMEDESLTVGAVCVYPARYLRVLTAKNSKKVVLIKFFEIQIDMFPESTFHGDFRAPHSLGLGSTVYA